ncbi:uncharacterized protein LY89DRAFT_789423 [Mollisia scopiformis]|uniref:Rhodopsin domain-containing protein n=1 Tax=Mollisia scopiformis TaxID=149040 RepID=A0A132B5Q6_MOLSC|nr:uncharacterized protein LY89DRAFT_789423 [Mollisia scopiformis]KUJ07732.1 hypothetical protein LY89DRAFT_789423 [Mollisia scopiformis]
MDMVLSILPWPTVWTLHMEMKRKIGVAIAMSMGVLAGIVAMVKAAIFLPAITSEDFSYAIVNFILWSFAEPAISIVAASLPMLRVLLSEVSSAAYTKYPNDGESRNHTIERQNNQKGSKSVHTVAITCKGQGDTGRVTDEGSDKSILERDIEGGSGLDVDIQKGAIVMRTETRVDFARGRIANKEEKQFEMRVM